MNQVISSFSEITIIPGYSLVEPWEVDIRGKASTSIALGLPLVSAPMDTVSEWKMAVAMALRGGLGVVHRNMSIEEQVENLRRVKEHPAVELKNLYVFWGEECCRVLDAMRSYNVRQIPVVDSDMSIVGYALYSSLRGCKCGERVGKYLAPGPIYEAQNYREALRLLEKGGWDVVAIAVKGVYLGSIGVEEALEEYNPTLDDEGRLRVGAAISPFDLERALKLERYADVLVADVAHFHNANVLNASRKLVDRIGVDFVAGNLGTREGVLDVLSKLERVNGLRVGIASGSICTTSGATGVSAPTPQAVIEAREALRELGASLEETPIIADGGARGTGDLVKALALGAYSVMTGYLLAGTDEAPAPIIRIGEKQYKPYRGMASRGALERRYSVDRYSRAAKRLEEGVEGLVEYRGRVKRVLKKVEEAIKAGLGYAGARSIPELWKKARIAKVSEPIGAYAGGVELEA